MNTQQKSVTGFGLYVITLVSQWTVNSFLTSTFFPLVRANKPLFVGACIHGIRCDLCRRIEVCFAGGNGAAKRLLKPIRIIRKETKSLDLPRCIVPEHFVVVIRVCLLFNKKNQGL